MRTADRDASAGTLEALAQIDSASASPFGLRYAQSVSLRSAVAAIRARMPWVKIVVRADSGFAREAIMAWCEAQEGVYYCIGLARNGRLEAMLSPVLAEARAQHCLCGGMSVRRFAELAYRTLDSWSCERRVIGKAEVSLPGDNPRFIVTNLGGEGLRTSQGGVALEGRGCSLYEEFYCERGQAENRIKQMTLDLQSDRRGGGGESWRTAGGRATSTHWLTSNQMRLWLSAFAYMLLERLRAWGLCGSALERATLGTVRRRLLKVAAQVSVSVRRVSVQFCSAFPLQRLFAECQQRLAAVESS